MPPALWIGILCLAVLGVADAILRHERGISGDEPYYARMATHPGAAHSFPYAYRIVVPWVVHALPFAQGTGFEVLALLSIAATGAALYALLDVLEIPGWLAGALSLGLAASPTLLVALLRNGRDIDPETILVMVLGCLFIVRRQRLALALTILVGVGVKETSLFLVPLAYAMWAERPIDGRAFRDVLAVAVAPIVGYLVLRAAVPAVGSQYTPGYTGSFLHIRLEILRKAFAGDGPRRLAYTYGPLWIAAPFALTRSSFARRGLVLIALCVAALSVSYDAQRVLFIAAPVVYGAAALAVRHKMRVAVLMVATLLCVDLAYAGYMQVHGVVHGLDTNPANPIPLH
jgi:hypothetical protein